MLSDKNLLEKNKRGLIHGPDESDNAFISRCKAAKSGESLTCTRASSLFDIDPDWIEMRYSDEHLRMWEGGCTWIGPDEVSIQLRKAFEKKRRYLGYAKEEILDHELVHVVRNGFEEPIFEEVLAYQTSLSRIRRFAGPFFRSSRESTFFVIALCLAPLSTLLEFYQLPVYAAIFSLIVVGTVRLIRTHRVFSQARRQVEKSVGRERALAVMLRLTDREIIRFSKMEGEQIRAHALKMSRTQPRWRQIYLSYF